MKQLAIFSTILLLAALAIPVAFAADITVSDDCGLAEAIEAANSDDAVGACPAGAGADAIILSGDLTLDEALPAIASAIAIEGGGFTIAGGGNRIFHVIPAGELHIADLTLTGGRTDEDSAACLEATAETDVAGSESSDESDEPRTEGFGGAICIDGGRVSISDSRFSDNFAERSGGAIASIGGELEIADSEFSGNSAGEHGGALYIEGGLVALSETIFSENQAEQYGGAIDNIAGARLLITFGEFTDNKATTGGAIGNWQSSLAISGSRFDANQAENGGAIQSEDGEPEICESQFSGNIAANFGAAIYSVRGSLEAAENDLRENRADEGGVIHIIEPEAATLRLSANNFADNEGEDCVACEAADRENFDCGSDPD